MGQEISQQNKCNIVRRQQHQTQHNNNNFKHQNYTNSNEKYTKHKDLIYTSSSISTASSTDDEHFRHRQKYNLPKQTYEKTKIAKKLSLISNTTTTSNSSTSDYQNSSIGTGDKSSDPHFKIRKSSLVYSGFNQQHQRKNSQSTDSGIYYSSCHCSSTSSAASTSSVSSTSAISSKSSKSLDKQKQYLSHHLYIKSYLDILEEDEKARAQFKSARPGGIRNYTPKILVDAKTPSATNLNAKVKNKLKDDPWI